MSSGQVGMHCSQHVVGSHPVRGHRVGRDAVQRDQLTYRKRDVAIRSRLARVSTANSHLPYGF